MPALPPIALEQLHGLSEVLADTLSQGEIERLLDICGITPVPGKNKTARIYEALAAAQKRYSASNKAIEFVGRVISPARYMHRPNDFKEHRQRINVVLALIGYCVSEDGSVAAVSPASSLRAATERANSLRSELSARGVHPEVFRFCRPEVLDENYFHAVLQSVKSLTERVRAMSGLADDGRKLFSAAFGEGQNTPILMLNAHSTDSERSEQRGFFHFLCFLYATFRNPAAHEAKINPPMQKMEAINILEMVSYAHKKLDSAVRNPLIPKP